MNKVLSRLFQPSESPGLMAEGKKFLIQSSSPDWVRRKIFLSGLCGSAVNLVLKEANHSIASSPIPSPAAQNLLPCEPALHQLKRQITDSVEQGR